MHPVFSARLGQAKATALVLLSGAAATMSGLAIADRAGALGSAFLWCRDFVLASVGGSSWIAAVAAFMLGAGVFRAAAFLAGETIRGARFRRGVAAHAVPLPARVSATAARAGIARIAAVADTGAFACTVGLFSPRIVLSTALISRMTRRELEAVVRHEAAHARRRDPLRAVLWEVFRRAFFFLPVMKDVAAHQALRREIDADADASAVPSDRRALAAALLKASVSSGYSCAFSGMSARSERARALLGERRVLLLVDVRRFAMSALVACSVALSGSASVRAAEAQPPRACPSGPQEQMSLINFSPYLKLEVRDGPMSAAVQSSSLRP